MYGIHELPINENRLILGGGKILTTMACSIVKGRVRFLIGIEIQTHSMSVCSLWVF